MAATTETGTVQQIPARYELKYVVPERLARAIARAIAPYCALDRHSAAQPDHQYRIISLYLDSPGRAFHLAKVFRQYRRLKLRVRTYNEQGNGPVLLEVKRKIGNVVVKGRTSVPPATWIERLIGPAPADSDLAERDFRSLLDRHGAQPTLLVRYRREAHVSQVDDYARVTFDRQLQYQASSTWDLTGPARGWSAHDDVLATHVATGVVLELKSTQAVPTWMQALVRRFDLIRCGFSKYCTGVERVWNNQNLSRPGDRAAVWA